MKKVKEFLRKFSDFEGKFFSVYGNSTFPHVFSHFLYKFPLFLEVVLESISKFGENFVQKKL